ncbi:MAG: hypothetical protein JHC62_06130 [Microbacteriaceae bacterium]|nr:hypothetical protein [Microbacteriaceae bacterium]
MADAGKPFVIVARVRAAIQPFARYAAALIAGVAITLTDDHSTYTGLEWLTFVVVVSLFSRGGPATVMNAVAWWSTLVVAALTLLGLIASRMSPTTALSLTIALVAFETSRAFTRSDRIWLWSTGVLAGGLSILYFTIDADDRTAAGLTGGWAIIAGIFGLIGAIDSRVKTRRSAHKPAASKSTTMKAKVKSRGTKR